MDDAWAIDDEDKESCHHAWGEEVPLEEVPFEILRDMGHYEEEVGPSSLHHGDAKEL